ncbi:embryo defective 1703 protein, putative [Medicago truncatula]|nr:embryo defective 1703 protein, putative [Medicago truncatula]
MDILNFSPPKTISYPFFCNPRTLYTSNRNTPFHKNTFSFYLTTSTSRKFQTLAHFRRPTNRRNSLRNKLLHDHQVSRNHIPNDPSSVSSNHVEEIDDASFVELEKLHKSELLGENVLLNKLDNWVDQYRKDIDFWGIGSAPIFTVYQDLFGGVKRVLVDEDEILKRVGGNDIEDKILEAKKLAREMESGENVIAKNSSVAKFIVQGEEEKGDFVKAVRGFIVQPGLVPKLSGVGGIVLCVFVMFGVKKLFRFGDKEVRYTEMEKKMMMRKAKARKEKEMLMKGAVEVIHESTETPVIGVKKPELDKEQLKYNILKAKASSDKLVVQNSSGEVITGSMDMDYKVREIREMARRAREIEGGDRSLVSKDMEMDDSVIGKSSKEIEVIKENSKQDNSLSNRQNEGASKTTDSNGILHTTSDDITENVDISIEHEIVRDDREICKVEIKINDVAMTPKDREDNKSSRTPINGSFMTNKSSVDKKPRIIRSVKEAKDYLSKKHDKENPDAKSGIELGKENMADSKPSEFVVFNDQKQKNLETNTILSRSDALNGLSYSKPDKNASEDSNQKEREKSPTKNGCSKDSGTEPGLKDLQKSETALDRQVNGIGSKESLPQEKSFDEVEPTVKQIRNDDTLNMKSDSRLDLNPSEDSDQKDKKFGPTKIGDIKDSGVEPRVANLPNSETTSDHEVNGDSRKKRFSGKTENWLEKNFHEVEPIIKKIRAGFRDNYALAKERVDQPLDIPTEMESIGVGEDGGEFDWMQDDHLRDIVFRVRDNELCGREPFYLMNDEDKDAFFRGLEKKVDIENKKLSHLHEWLHSNIENIDYGADGISIYDSPEKIIPRWKGPSVEKIPESLNEFLNKKIKTTSTGNLKPVKKDGKDSAKKSADSSSKVKVDGSIAPMKKSKNPKTVVEGSDGSVKAGKKSGKEYWQHTKKWSQEFLDCYNAETDPEVKSVMKDIGKDLDRWITEKEIEEAADLMSKLPERNRSFVEKKINKLKREMELFGPQAVVSKYREYEDDKEEDYLWWLDLPYVLCIEVYKVDDGEERVGFYSLEMAPDLELEPKPYHVIAFQDPGDCKNLCYIMQAHMDMLGGGNAFVVARPPKDAFRDAKENGFGVTVIKKGELQLNIDQPLEEVEEEITEIGSKMYHDKITKDRSVDINSIMKGVFGFNGSAKR